MSVGKMGSEARVGPGISKLKTGFFYNIKIHIHFN